MSPKKTKIYKARDAKLTEAELEELDSILKKGELIVFPTETVYGLGCLYSNKAAREMIFDIKNRPKEKELPVMVRDVEMIKSLFSCKYSSLTEDIMRKFIPGPVTVILNCKDGRSLGFRIPAHEVVLNLISTCKEPLTATSANVSGGQETVDFRQAQRLFYGKVAAMIDGGHCYLSEPSTIIDLRLEDNFRIIREGVYGKALIKRALSNPKRILFVCTGNSCRSIMAVAILKEELKRKKITDIEITSAGTAALDDMPPSQDTLRVLTQEGLETAKYASKRLNETLLKEADLVLTMEAMHTDYILKQQAQLKYKTFGFSKFATGLEQDIPDPIGRGIEEYRRVFSLIKEAIGGVVKKIT